MFFGLGVEKIFRNRYHPERWGCNGMPRRSGRLPLMDMLYFYHNNVRYISYIFNKRPFLPFLR